MKLTRTSIISLVGCALLIGIGTAFSYANTTASPSKRAIENAFEDMLGVSVSIESFTVPTGIDDPVHVKNVNFSNPSGFSRSPAITIDSIDMDLSSPDTGKLAIKNMVVKGMVFHVDTNSKTVNLEALKRSIADRRDNHDVHPLLSGDLAIDHIVVMGMRTEPANITAAIAHGLSPQTLAEDHMQGLGTVSAETAQRILIQVIVHLIDTALYEAHKKGYLEDLAPENRPTIRHPE